VGLCTPMVAVLEKHELKGQKKSFGPEKTFCKKERKVGGQNSKVTGIGGEQLNLRYGMVTQKMMKKRHFSRSCSHFCEKRGLEPKKQLPEPGRRSGNGEGGDRKVEDEKREKRGTSGLGTKTMTVNSAGRRRRI